MSGWENIQQGNGFMLMLVGMVVVFSALVLLMFLMKGLKRYQEKIHSRRMLRDQATGVARDSTDPNDFEDIEGTVAAAIAITLLLEEESVHDEESLVLTLNQMRKPYSNWWQSRIDRDAWPAEVTPGRPAVLSKKDPVTGGRV